MWVILKANAVFNRVMFLGSFSVQYQMVNSNGKFKQ